MPFPFSSKTVGLLVEAISEGHTETKMRTLFLKAGVDSWEPEQYKNKEHLAQQVLYTLRYEVSEGTGADGALELARLVLVSGKPQGWRYDGAPWFEPLKHSISADGWEFDEGSDEFVAAVPGTQMPEEVTWVGSDLQRRGWTVAQGHYEQAVENFAAGNWAAANGQLRAFLESLIRTAGGTSNASGAGQVQAAFDALDGAGHLIADEADFGKKLWKMLHTGGSHPGLSNEDESRFRLLTLTGYARFLLTRLP